MRVGPWSWEVRGSLEKAVGRATAAGALDLRSRTPLPGSTPLTAHEHVLALPTHLPDPAATRALGRRLAGALRVGDLVVLDGPLGAGKTSLTQGLGEALGVRGRVTSPTFVLAREHRGPLPLVHVDAYRLRDTGAGLDDLELDAALEVGVVVVEWGAGLVEGLADAWLRVDLERDGGTPGDDATGRRATVRPAGPRWSVLPGPDVTV